MKILAIPRHHILIISILTLLINLLFFSVTQRRHFFSGLVTEHGEIGYNFYTNNNPMICRDRLNYVSEQQVEQLRLFEYAELSDHNFEKIYKFRSVNDTIGYGILLGFLWKITGSLRYRDIQILQIIIFCLLILFLYKLALLLFNNKNVALLSCIAQLFFFPLIFLNVHPLRDIWAYYGIVMMLYGLLSVSREKPVTLMTFFWAFLVALCQWLRPTIFFTLIAVAIPLWLWKQESMKAWLVFFVMNIILFWLPFIMYNNIAYDRAFVSPAGQDLFEGLGEFVNPWKIKMDDGWAANLIQNTYDVRYGTPEFQDKAHELFLQAITEHPWVYVGQILRRIPTLFFFNATWSYEGEDLIRARSIKGIGFLLWLITKAIGFILARFQYVRFYLLLGWIGAFLLLKQRQYLTVSLLILIAFSCASKLPSHLEPRYLVPHYALFSLFVGYTINQAYFRIKRYYTKSTINHTDTAQPIGI
jgi:hypothetical protein